MFERFNQQNGYSIIELIAAMGLFAVLSGIALMNFSELDNPSKTGAQELASYFKEIRTKAISSTSAYTIYPQAGDSFIAKSSDQCSSATKTIDNSVAFRMPHGASISNIAWTLCYNARGFPDGNLTLTVNDLDGDTKTVEVFLGGAVRVQ